MLGQRKLGNVRAKEAWKCLEMLGQRKLGNVRAKKSLESKLTISSCL